MDNYVKAFALMTEVGRLMQLSDDTLILALLSAPHELIGDHVNFPEAEAA